MKKKPITFGKIIYVMAVILIILAIALSTVLFILYALYGQDSHRSLYAILGLCCSGVWLLVTIPMIIGYLKNIKEIIPTGHTRLWNHYVDKKEGRLILAVWIFLVFFLAVLFFLGFLKYK